MSKQTDAEDNQGGEMEGAGAMEDVQETEEQIEGTGEGGHVEVSDETGETGGGDGNLPGGSVGSEPERLSKKQQRRQKREEMWNKIKEEKKAAKLQKKQEQPPPPPNSSSSSSSASSSSSSSASADPTRLDRAAFQAKQKEDFLTKCREGPSVVIDCEFAPLLTEKELKSLVQQSMYVYGANRKAKTPVQLHFTGVDPKEEGGGAVADGFRRLSGCDTWLCSFHKNGFADVFPKDRLVYLTSDSETSLTSLDSDRVFVIGGIVDRNRLKGQTKTKAEELKLQTAKLPIADHVQLDGSKVLTVNQVFDILLKFLEFRDWRSAFLAAIAPRKFATETDMEAAKEIQQPLLVQRERREKGEREKEKTGSVQEKESEEG
uniref:tRNA (guanine(9)-N(1))-methyltransferase n=1 Tax=Chromera velia CCMP2878 TaxID=1169474 RepID=A0A0G4GWW7_9ALVE|eukprot:Cvel_5322.t1-p1 / transcript=Cvel_5322.t1 / gene=Cvel_5322 / organism=Chromera_velia_CCMP2878 / gene_product=tRNA methyltransferase 10 homolog A, putative / transcript_product=tRNA methyltransferase 10 homolog A, putative / location=Cvel_scaffold246:100994-102998(-) / protein_length=374 / sequence_SO=supercontig / SO=protein_coding / is_pseudo=false